MTTESLAWASRNAYSLPFTIEFNQKCHRKTELIRSALSQTLLIHIFCYFSNISAISKPNSK
jgi:hypothetical protein